MSNENWTKGEWEILEYDSFDGVTIGQPAGYGYYHIASAPERGDGGEDDEEMNANANLIAAAPDLYLAVKELIESSVFMREEYSDMNEAVSLAEKALAKARGEL
jgi:hypothetical protein